MLFLLCNAGRFELGVLWVTRSFDPHDYDDDEGFRRPRVLMGKPTTTYNALKRCGVVTGMEAGHLRETLKNTPPP